MKNLILGLVLSMVAWLASATGPVPVTRSGLAGIAGFTFYDPYCGHGCFRSFSPYTLSCSSVVSAGGHTTADEAAHRLALCRASHFPYLSSIAWCMHLYCPKESVRASRIETFWETEITGDIQVLPQWSYGEVLANITEPPTEVAPPMGMPGTDRDMVLNRTMLTTYENWYETQETLVYFFRETALESYYGLSLCLTAFALPIALTWLGYLPFATRLLGRLRPWLYPSVVGTYHDRPLPFLIGNAPTVGQSAYIAVVVVLNLVFLSVGYKTLWPHRVMQWYADRYQERMAYFMWRTGVLAFCQMPVLFLFSTRNSPLLWLTRWSHSTYMLLHRWLARLFLLQALLHSLLALVLYQSTGAYAASLVTGWWIWGCVATVAAVLVVLTSLLVLRRRAYELFLATHVVLAVVCVVGCWYHVYIGYENTFGYETWLYATVAVWFFDRAARVARMARCGVRWARVTDVNETIARVDIPGIRWAGAGRCVYVYFPTLHPLRPWENHPFSTIPTVMLGGGRHRAHTDSDRAGSEAGGGAGDREKGTATVTLGNEHAQHPDHHEHHPHRQPQDGTYTTAGLTLFVRKSAGMTGTLKACDGLLTLVEGPYPTNPTRSILHSDRLLLVGGGIGITGLLPFLWRHPNAKLFHSVKASDAALVEALRVGVLDEVTEKEVRVGRRLDVEALLREEAAMGWRKVGVVVCGPAGMCDDVRAVVARLGRERVGGCTFELEVDAFSW